MHEIQDSGEEYVTVPPSWEAERGAGRSRAGRRIGAGGVDLRPPGLRQWVAGPDPDGRRGVGDGREWEAGTRVRCGVG